MQKHITLPVLAILAGICGFFLRLWHLRTALNPETEIFSKTAPSTIAMLVLTALALLLLFALCREARANLPYHEAFFAPTPIYMALMVIAAIFFIVAAAFLMRDIPAMYTMWKYEPKYNAPPVMQTLTAAFYVPTAVSVLLLGKGNYRNTLPESYAPLTTIPAFASLLFLIFSYQDFSRDPQPLRYGWRLFSCVFIVLALYCAASFSYEKAKPALTLFWSLGGIFLICINVADIKTFDQLFTLAAFGALLLSNAIPLLRSQFGPAYPRRLERMPQRGNAQEQEETIPENKIDLEDDVHES